MLGENPIFSPIWLVALPICLISIWVVLLDALLMSIFEGNIYDVRAGIPSIMALGGLMFYFKYVPHIYRLTRTREFDPIRNVMEQ